MAELGATVAGLLSLTITVIDISNRYFSNVKNATRIIKGYFRELEALKLLLVNFKALESQGLPTATTTALEGCHSELERLRTKLQKRSSGNAFSNALHRLTWPFAEEETRHLVEVVHRYLDVFHAALSVDNIKLGSTTLEAVTRNETRAIYVERRRVLGWLSAANPYSNHTAARDKCGASTGGWLFESSEFLKWHQNEQRSIWWTGIPGAGKTILCSTVIEFLQQNRKVNEAVLIWYFDFSDDHKQSLDALLRSLLAQACELLDTIPSEVTDLFETNNGHPRHLSLDRRTLLDLLKNIFASFDAVTVVIDALDESSEVSGVLGFFHDLNGTDFENVKWLVTSRQKQEIEDSLLGTQIAVMPLDNAFIDADIRCYLGDCLTRDPKLSSKPARIKQQIEDVLTEKAHGMLVIKNLFLEIN
jgi:NACHT domain